MKKSLFCSALCAAIFLALGCSFTDKNIEDGAYWHPYLTVQPEAYWNCPNVFYHPYHNSLEAPSIHEGLRYHLLAQSIAGLVHRAVQEGRTKVSVWMGAEMEPFGYGLAHQALHDMGIKPLGVISAMDLALKTQSVVDGIDTDVRHLFDGYVLTDVENNPESAIVAATASHVFNAIIVDVRDRRLFDEAGYKMLYDATRKNTVDSWHEFRDKCNNNAVVLMPVQTGELREFAICNNLFVFNLNHYYADASKGDNFELYHEVMEWLEPGSPVYGWDQGVDEAELANTANEWGNFPIPYDWGFNTTLTSLNYPERQDFKCKNIDPNEIDYSIDKKFVSYYLSDGNNVPWMLNNFDRPLWYQNEHSVSQNMTYGIALASTSMICPIQMAEIFDTQADNVTLMESSTYIYLDTYGIKKDRTALLKNFASWQANHMRRHDNRIFWAVNRYDGGSPEALEAYQALIDANEELEGIIAIQYSPYADGQGRIYWLKNKKGWDIPIICTKYSIWNMGNRNDKYEGSPAYIAHKLKTDSEPMSKYSFINIHAWSKFWDKGLTDDELAENVQDQYNVPWEEPDIITSAGAAELCSRRLGDDFKVVNAQEMIWRIRMAHNPEQTKEAMSDYNQ